MTGVKPLHTAARVLAGVGSLALGLWLGGWNATEVEADWRVTLFAVVVAAGGALLIAGARWQARTTRPGRIAGVVTAVAGLLAAGLAPAQETCCDVVWVVSLGLPLPWTTGYGDTWSLALQESLTSAGDPLSALLNVLFWAHVAMLVTVAVSRLPSVVPTARR